MRVANMTCGPNENHHTVREERRQRTEEVKQSRERGGRKENGTHGTKRRAVELVDTRGERNSGAGPRVTVVAVGAVVHVVRHCVW